jgi:hypothetical protein
MADGAQDQREAGIRRLAEYWGRARLMHHFLHEMRAQYDNNLNAIWADGHGWEFVAYAAHWLSGLFVVVEGFNKLRLKSAHVQQLFNSHLPTLKAVRHETYHFTMPRVAKLPDLNWAEELHEAIGEHIRELVLSGQIKESARDFMRWRTTKRPSAK